ncbi:alpha/beta fold hydrolase [Anaeromyxobacter oryzae]|uniref:Alpha/beta hydrolase n=1 Tax=Anaeromyxobacter oryzae TaxID=2918170 RepID=A0ABM7WUH3_9BACT|nr:alpha/beta hydrolase [Anaeromyxobacter oryzae]BDG03148.1 alpha/beta hydrolase [Anaeromyxobacter oryzae]
MHAQGGLAENAVMTAATDGRPVAVTTRRGPVECVVSGDGPAVLALHGAMGGHDQALLLARTIGAPGFRYVAPSRPGYLGTPLSLGRTPAEQAALYRDLLDALGIERAAVIAVSGGGPSALQLALDHPERCWGLVVVSSVCRRVETRLPLAWHLMKLTARCGPLVAAMRRRAARDPEEAARRSIRDPALRARTLRDPEAGPLLRELQLSTLDRMPRRLAGTENDVAVTRGELSFPLERLAVPLLVVHGTDDAAAPFAQGEELAARVPGAELLAIPGGEHVSIFTHRDLVRARVARFLRAHAPPAA